MRRNNNQRRGRNTEKKEKIIMIVSSAFVLTALTLTGVYVKNSNRSQQNDGYRIDFEQLENRTNDNLNNIKNAADQIEDKAEGIIEDKTGELSMENDLDYTPMEEAGSADVEIPGLTDQAKDPGQDAGDMVSSPDGSMSGTDADMDTDMAKKEKEDEKEPEQNTQANTSTVKKIDWKAGETLIWPVNGSVLIPYSMDKTVYFKTLDQYKYSAAMVLSAEEGTAVSTPVSGTVKAVYTDAEIGNAIRIDIGNGYEIIYGQLNNICVKEGSSVSKDSVIGYVASPSKYYSLEGCNLYISLLHDNVPVDPMGVLQ